MAGGNANDIRAPYPKGGDSVVPLIFSGLTKVGAQTGTIVLASMTLPFSCKCVYAEAIAGQTAVTDADADTALLVQDDTAGTTKKWVNNVTSGNTLTALAAGARRQFVVDKSVELYAQSILQVAMVFGDAGDVFDGLTIVLWVQPTN